MIVAKSPHKIIKEFRDGPMPLNLSIEEWLYLSMSSVIMWSAQQAEKRLGYSEAHEEMISTIYDIANEIKHTVSKE